MKKINFRIIFLISIVGSYSSVSAQKNRQNNVDSSVTPNLLVDSTLYYKVIQLEQDVAKEKKGESHFMVVGLATMGFVFNRNATLVDGKKASSTRNSLLDADRFEVSPMLLWRHGKHLLIEFEPSWNGNSIGVNWGDISYFVKPGFIVRAGYLVLPFGAYNKRLAAGWINKLGSDPIGIAGYPPSSDFGVEVEGGLPLGDMKWSYDISLTNGLQLLNDGTIQNFGITSDNKNKTVTGRVALLPISNSCLELGVSGLYGGIGDNNSHKNATTTMYAFDLNFVKSISSILVNVKAQYSSVKISKENYISPVDSSTYTFLNQTSSFFGQASLRATKAPGILKNFELAGRYVKYTTPVNSTWGAINNEYDFAIDYWFTWRSVLKLVYETNDIKGTVPFNFSGYQNSKSQDKRLIIQYSVQF